MRKLGSTASCPECGIAVIIKNSRRNPGHSTMVACVRKMQQLLDAKGLEVGLGQPDTTSAVVKGGRTENSSIPINKDPPSHATPIQAATSASPRPQRRTASQTKTPVSAIKGLTLNSPSEQTITPTTRARPRRSLVRESFADVAIAATPPKKQRATSQSRRIVQDEGCHPSPPSLLTIITSGLSADQRMIVESSYRQIPRARISLINTEGGNVTHLLTSTNAAGLAPRTAKYLRGVLRGLAIVSYDWYLASLAEGPVPIEPYLIRGDDVIGVMTDAVARSMAAHQRGDPPLFAKHSFFISGTAPGSQGAGPTRHELASLIEAGGGKVLSRKPSSGEGRRARDGRSDETIHFLVILHNTNGPIAESDDDLQYRPYSWLFDCISHYRIL